MCCCTSTPNKSSLDKKSFCNPSDVANKSSLPSENDLKQKNEVQQLIQHAKVETENNVLFSQRTNVLKDEQTRNDKKLNAPNAASGVKAEKQELRAPFSAVSISKNTVNEKRNEMTTLSHPVIHELEPSKSRIIHSPVSADRSEISQSICLTSPKALEPTVASIPIFSPKLSAESSSVFDIPSKMTEESFKNASSIKITVPEVRVSSKTSELHSNHNSSSGIMGQRLFPVTLPLLKSERHSAKLVKSALKYGLTPKMQPRNGLSEPCLDNGICFEKTLVSRVYKAKSATKRPDMRDSPKSGETTGILQPIGDRYPPKITREDHPSHHKLTPFRPRHSRQLFTSNMTAVPSNPGPFLPALASSTHLTNQATRLGKTGELHHKRVDHIKDTFPS